MHTQRFHFNRNNLLKMCRVQSSYWIDWYVFNSEREKDCEIVAISIFTSDQRVLTKYLHDA